MPTISALRRPAAVLILFSAAATAAVATGDGGLTSDVQVFEPSFSSHDLAATAYGGFRYGSNGRGTQIGGFGIFITDQVDNKRLVDRRGGNVTRQELVLSPFTRTITGWTKIGGIAAEALSGSGDYFALYEELDLKVGFAPLPWMQIVGYQVVVSFLTGFFANEAVSVTPTVGFELVWRSLRADR